MEIMYFLGGMVAGMAMVVIIGAVCIQALIDSAKDRAYRSM